MVAAVRPFLMFKGEAEDALRLYMSLFPNSSVSEIVFYGPEGPGAAGTVLQAKFTLAGQDVMCIDSPVEHDFALTPAFSFFVDCSTEVEIDRIAAVLADGGKVFMPLGDYGFGRRFTWLSDRFGVSWQLNLA
ncbi:MAG: VOC family protein [Pseudomonadota bacterium]